MYVETTTEGKVAAYPWVWVRGGRSREGTLRKALGVQAAQWDCRLEAGMVPVARIILKPQKNDLDASPLLNAIVAPLLELEKKQWRKVWEVATSGN